MRDVCSYYYVLLFLEHSYTCVRASRGRTLNHLHFVIFVCYLTGLLVLLHYHSHIPTCIAYRSVDYADLNSEQMAITTCISSSLHVTLHRTPQRLIFWLFYYYVTQSIHVLLPHDVRT